LEKVGKLRFFLLIIISVVMDLNNRLESLSEAIGLETKEKDELIEIIGKLKKEKTELLDLNIESSQDLSRSEKERKRTFKELENLKVKRLKLLKILERALYEDHTFIIDIAKKEGITGKKIKELFE